MLNPGHGQSIQYEKLTNNAAHNRRTIIALFALMFARLTLLPVAFLVVAVNGTIPHEDPGLLFRAGDKNRDGVMDKTELAEFYVHRADTMNGKTIADIAGGPNKATMQMDINKDGALCPQSCTQVPATITVRSQCWLQRRGW